MISLSKLRAFSVVADHGSFTVAARASGLSAAALSTRVAELERQLGITLLQRTTRRVELTHEGRRLYERSKRVLAELDTLADDLSDEGKLQGGRVVVSCVPTLAAMVCGRALGRFSEMHPHIVVHLIDEPTSDLRDRVLSNEADFGLGPNPGGEFAFEHLTSDRFVLTCPIDDPLAQRESVGGKELARLPLVTLARGSNVRKVLDDYFERQGLVLSPRFEVNHHHTLGALVLAGLGYGPLPSLAVKLTGESRLATVPIQRPICERPVGVITRRGNRLSPAAEALLEVVRQAFV
ncbi:MAG: LysR substrate-binding domain-containing protein [Pigmentiphaga sp.]|nr:LysR substrate-binding domain-containing protein [Pigmentiphaga sp.]